MNDNFKLGARDGLPDDLLFLAKKHPRDTWRSKPGLAGTGEFWLANHDFFRQITARISAELQQVQEKGATTYQTMPMLNQHIGRLLSGLEGHHNVEDHHYFPAFQRAEPRLVRAFEILDADHEMIHEAIDQLAASARENLRKIGHAEGVMISEQRFAVDALAEMMNRFRPTMLQHLADEEEIVIPLILERAQSDPEFG
jgi:iron-sulfur cluster repair protein YtfE (RIC family)